MTDQPENLLSRLRKERATGADLPRLLRNWYLIGLAGFLQPFLKFFMPDAAGHDSSGNLVGADFAVFWTGAKQALAGQAQRLYDAPDFIAAMGRAMGTDYSWHYFSYAPNILPLIAVFGLLPYLPALGLWVILGAAGLVAAVRANRFCRLSVPFLCFAALSPAALVNLIAGHNGAFTGALFLGGFYLCEANPLTAGILFGLLTFKPHLGILIPAALLLRRNWRCMASATATAAALAALSLVLWGIAPWQAFLEQAVPIQKATLQTTGQVFCLMMPGPYADAAMSLKVSYPWLLYAPAALLALFVALATVRRDGITPRSVLVLALSTIIIAPYGFNYDMVAVEGALVVYIATVGDLGLLTYLALGLLWALPLLVMEIKFVTVWPVSSAVLLGALLGIMEDRAKIDVERSADSK